MKDVYRFLLRLPTPLRDPLAAAAEESGRSLNSEIVHRLEQSLATEVRRFGALDVLAFAPAVAVAALALAVGAGFLGQPRSSASPISSAGVAAPKFVPDGTTLSPRAAAGLATVRPGDSRP